MTGDQLPLDANRTLIERLDIDFALQAAGLGVWELDPVTNLLNWDDRCGVLFGLAQSNRLPYEQAIQSIHPDDRTRVTQAVQWALNPQSGGNYEETYRVVDSKPRWVRVHGRAYFTESGQVYRFAGVAQDVTQPILDRQAAEDAQNQALAAAQAPVALAVLTGPRLTYQMANAFYCQLVDRTTEQLVGRPVLEALPEANGPDFIALLEQVIATGIPYEAKEAAFKVHRQNGQKTLYVDFTYLPWQENGHTTGVMLVATDVTQQVLARQKVEASESRLRGIIAAAPAGIGLFVGRDLLIEYPNQTFIDIVGKGPGVAGRPLREAMPELLTEGQPFLKILDEVYTTGVPFISPASLVRIVQNGVLTDNYYNISYTPVYDAAGEIYAILDIALDVTAQVKAQRALAESEAHLELLRDAVPAMIFYLDAQQRYQSYNGVFRDWFGVDDQGAIGKTVREFLGEEAYRNALPHLAKAYSGQPAQYETYAPLRLQADRWLSIVYTPHKTAAGSVLGLIVHATDITQRKRDELALRHSEARFRSVIENTPIATALFRGKDLVVDLANEVMIGYWQKGPGVVGKPYREAVPELVGQGYFEKLDEIFSTGREHHDAEARADITENGVSRTSYFDYSYTPLFDEAGQVYAVLNMGNDVTERVLARQKVEESEARFRTMAEGTSVLIAVGDETSNATYFNTAWAELTGRPGDELLQFGWVDLVHPQDRERYVSLYLDAFTLRRPFTGELRVLNPQGAYRWLLAHGVPRFQTDGTFAGYISSCVDITERKQQQLLVEEKEAALRNALEIAQLGTWTMDIASKTMELSLRHLHLFGLPHSPLTVDEALDRLVDTDRERVARAFYEAQQPNSAGKYAEEYTIINGITGQRLVIRALGQTYFDEEGKPVRIAGTAQDITLERAQQLALENEVRQRTEELAAANSALAASNEEYAALNDELEEANGLLLRSNENLQRFAYVASHDLQEPLRKIQQFGDLLKTRYADSAGEELVYLERMQSAASRMSTLIRDLLDFSRISTQRESSVQVPLNEVIDQVLTTLELVIAENQAEVKVAPLPTILGDATQLNQLFQNLLSNALKFRQPTTAPVIRIGADTVGATALPPSVKPTRMAKEYYRIQVADNGVGFDEKYLDRIFQVFQRLHGKNQFSGTGIGLAICEKVVANHGGAITASSQPGQGATFSIYVPL